MIVSLNIKDNLVSELFELFKTNDLNSIVNTALESYINQNNTKIIDLFNCVEYNEDYDYKALR